MITHTPACRTCCVVVAVAKQRHLPKACVEVQTAFGKGVFAMEGGSVHAALDQGAEACCLPPLTSEARSLSPSAISTIAESRDSRSGNESTITAPDSSCSCAETCDVTCTEIQTRAGVMGNESSVCGSILRVLSGTCQAEEEGRREGVGEGWADGQRFSNQGVQG